MLSAKTLVPVLGVPVPSRHLSGNDSLLSIVQMPKGIPVATFAIGAAGAANAAQTMDVNGFAGFNFLIHPVQNTGHFNAGGDQTSIHGLDILSHFSPNQVAIFVV